MDIRGQRECQSCGARWSYYESADISCPVCGSIRSVGVDERKRHTAGNATLALDSITADIGDEPIGALADRASDAARSYIKPTGFIHAGELQPLSDRYLTACELRRVGATLGRVMQIEEDEQLYFLQLLRAADSGDRPEPSAVPATLHPERGLAVTAGIDAYLGDLREFVDEREARVDTVLAAVTTQRKRIEALEGDVDPEEAEELVRTVRDLADYLRDSDDTALTDALERVETEQL